MQETALAKTYNGTEVSGFCFLLLILVRFISLIYHLCLGYPGLQGDDGTFPYLGGFVRFNPY